jgi:uncharacterized membrane protein YsdA (DUF1294 family)
MSPVARTASYWLSGTLLAITTALILEGAFQLPLLLGWLIGINLFTLIYYGIDKLNAVYVAANPREADKKLRIPESALLLLALVGGSPAAALAMILLPHKTQKPGFVSWFLLILLAQAAFVYLLWDRLLALLSQG